MNYLTCVLINGPLVILNIMANAFYIFCMVCPLCSRDRIKQPPKILLGSLICCTITYLLSLIMRLFFELLPGSYVLRQTSYLVVFCSLSTSMTTSVWLNFFYYTKIVPAQRVLFIWIKKNIKSIIYCIWLFERIYNLIDFTVIFLDLLHFDRFGFTNNFTMVQNIHIMPGRSFLKYLADMYIIVISIQKAHFLLCLCVMVMSSGSTVVYLCRHMRRMVANGHPFSCPRFSGQVRVTVTGILQGVLYVGCAVWTVYSFFSQHLPDRFISPYIHITVVNLYMSGTTFNLGAGQAVFRQRAADIWLRATKVQQSEQGG